MKNRLIKISLKAIGVIFAILAIFCLFTYTQLWNSKVDFSIKNSVNFPLTIEQRLEDFDYLYSTLRESFPYFEVKKRQYGYDWLDKKDQFRERIASTESDLEFYNIVDEFLILLQNGHTNIIAPGKEFKLYRELYKGLQPWGQVYDNKNIAACYVYWDTIVSKTSSTVIPVAFQYIEGDYYASDNLMDTNRGTEEFGIPTGSKLIMVDGIDTDTYIQSLAGQRSLKVDPIRNKYKINLLKIKTNNSVELSFISPSGGVETKVLEPFTPEPIIEVDREKPENLFSSKILEDKKVAYLKLPSLSSQYVKKDREGIHDFLKQVSDYPALIIDIRGNGGGSTNYWMNNIVPLLTDKTLRVNNYLLFRDFEYIKPFIKHKMLFGYYGLKNLDQLTFSKDKPGLYFENNIGLYDKIEYVVKPRNPVGFTGKIIMLVDDRVYSSAESFAAFAKATKWATLIGTCTGGDGIGFDPVPIALPNSGLIIRFPAEMGLNPDGSINDEVATEPDIYIEPSYGDFIGGLELDNNSYSFDTILKAALELVLE